MTKEQILALVSSKIEGQGNQVDIGSALPEILRGIMDLTSTQPFESFSYADLKAKRDAGELVVGTLYRITDYVATTIQSGTRSANHPFDLIVMAVTESELDAHAIAVPHDGDHYFDGFKLTAWDILYTIDNDDRYTWALTDHAESEETTFYRRPMMDAYVENVKFYGYWDLSGERVVWFTEEIKQAGTYALYYQDGDGFATDEDVTIISFEESTGKGVIYHMVDEFGNERQFDFKGIQFLRGQDWCEESKHESFVADVFDGVAKDWWLYALSWIAEDGTVHDVSLLGNSGALKDNGGRIIGCHDTKIGSVSAYDIYDIDGLFALDRNVMVSSYSYGGDVYYGTYGIQMGVSCHDNTFGNSCHDNTFGNDCYGNTFGNSCFDNIFGNSCSDNAFGTYFQNNTFGNSCHDNTFGNSCHDNIFGNSCYGNTFGTYFQNNTFGNSCHDNTFGNSCHDNTFGNSCYNNTFGNNVDKVQHINVSNGVHGKTLTVAKNVAYCQFVGLTTGGQIKVWNPADNV